MSEDWLRRRLTDLAHDPPVGAGRLTGVLDRVRRRRRVRTAVLSTAAAAALLVAATAVTGGGGAQSLVADDPTPAPTASASAAAEPAPTASPSPTPSAGPAATAVPAQPGPSGPSAAPVAATTGPRHTPVLLGFVGDLPGEPEGPLPSTAGGAADLLRAWADDVNAGGGLGGRPVELLLRDAGFDQGDRRRTAQELVDAGVVAVVGAQLTLGGDRDAGAQVFATHGVPMVGGDLGSGEWRTNPLAFPQGTLSDELSESVLAVLGAEVHGDDRDAAVVCLDGDACDVLEAQVEDGRGVAYGLRGTFVERVGVTETNYAPIVQRLRQAGTDVVGVQLFPQQARALAVELQRQGVRPDAVVVQADLASGLAAEPAADGWWAVQPVFPHVQRDGAAARFHRVGEGLELGAAEARTWASAVLLERTVAALGDEPATRAALARALRGLQGERLGGLVPLLDPGGSPPTTCVLVARVATRAWTVPATGRERCLAG